MVAGWKAPGIEHGMVYDHPERRDWCSVDYRTDGALVNQALDTATLGGRFLDPANPEVQAFALNMLADLASYKELDGIVMDRCRYDDYAMDAGYTEAGRRAFSAFLGREPERWPVFTEPRSGARSSTISWPGPRNGCIPCIRSSVSASM